MQIKNLVSIAQIPVHHMHAWGRGHYLYFGESYAPVALGVGRGIILDEGHQISGC